MWVLDKTSLKFTTVLFLNLLEGENGETNRGKVEAKSEKFTIKIHIVIKQRESEPFIAHCLDFDLVTTGKTEDEVKGKIEKTLLSHIRYALENKVNPYHSAPQKYWKEWWDGIQERAPEESRGRREDVTDNDKFDIELEALCPA